MAFESVREILEGISEIEPEKIQGINGVMLFDTTGEDGGQWTLTLTDGGITLEEGETTTPDVTFSMDAQDFVDIAESMVLVPFVPDISASFQRYRVR